MTSTGRPVTGARPVLRWGRQERPLVIGHRGASALETENTLPAFLRAEQDGADGVELDVLQCATGEVVVFHDDDLLRLCGLRERIADLSWRRLSRIRLPGGHGIPTLMEVLDRLVPATLVNVELKAVGEPWGRIERLVEAVGTQLDATSAEGRARVLLSSFSVRAMALVGQRCPTVARAFLIERETVRSALRSVALPLLGVGAVNPGRDLATNAFVVRAHALGYAVNVWTVDQPDELRALRARGVDGLICNDPAAARKALE